MSGWFEVYKNGKPTGYLFLSIENATLWIKTHDDGSEYTVFPYIPV